MSVNIRNLRTYNNGGDGAAFDNVDVTIDGLVSSGNGGLGVSAKNVRGDIANIETFDNAMGGVKFTEDYSRAQDNIKSSGISHNEVVELLKRLDDLKDAKVEDRPTRYNRFIEIANAHAGILSLAMDVAKTMLNIS